MSRTSAASIELQNKLAAAQGELDALKLHTGIREALLNERCAELTRAAERVADLIRQPSAEGSSPEAGR